MAYSEDIKFYAQRDRHSCGPIAILNAMKWCKIKCSYINDLKEISEYSNTKKEGTYDFYCYFALRYFLKGYAVVEKHKDLPKKTLIKYLKNENYAAIVGHPNLGADYFHYSFWYHATDNSIYAANLLYNENKSRFLIRNMPNYDIVFLVRRKYE